MAQEIEKKFKISYANVITSSQTFHDLYELDKADFMNKDPQTFTANYGTDFQTKIDLAAASGTDETQLDEQVGETLDVSVKMKEAKEHFQETMKYWIEKTFPNDKAKWNEFGFNDYDEASRSHAQMIIFYNTFKTMMTTDGAALVARGCKQTDVDKAATLEAELRAEKTEQQIEIKQRKSITQARIIKYNSVWDVMQEINKGSKATYPDDHAKQSQYFMPETPGGGGTPPPPPLPGP